jgi:hypothetical protein
MYIDLLKYPLFLSDFNENLILATNFRKYSKFHEDPSSASRVVACGLTDGPTDRTELVVALRNFPSAPKNSYFVFTTGNTSALTRIALLSVQVKRKGGIIWMKNLGAKSLGEGRRDERAACVWGGGSLNCQIKMFGNENVKKKIMQ